MYFFYDVQKIDTKKDLGKKAFTWKLNVTMRQNDVYNNAMTQWWRHNEAFPLLLDKEKEDEVTWDAIFSDLTTTMPGPCSSIGTYH